MFYYLLTGFPSADYAWNILLNLLTILGALSSIPLIYSIWQLFSKYTWHSAKSSAKRITKTIIESNNIPMLIVCIGRGGAIWGSLISYQLKRYGNNVDILAIDRHYETVNKSIHVKLGLRPEHVIINDPSEQKILLVAGDTHTGNTMETAVSWLQDLGIKGSNIQLATFFLANNCRTGMDYYGIKGGGAKRMPWYPSRYKSDSRIVSK